MDWQPNSLFLRSEMIFWRAYSTIEDAGDALVVRTPDNPFWRWGHLIVLKSPPNVLDVPRWRAIHAEKLAPYQARPRLLVAWDGPELDDEVRQEFESLGFDRGAMDYLVLRSLRAPAKAATELTIRELSAGDVDWKEVLATNIECYGPDANNPDFAEMTERRVLLHQRNHVATGAGHWYAGYRYGAFAGSLGIFRGDGREPSLNLWRFQNVAVRSAFRKKGVASSMLAHACSVARQERPDYPIVIAGRSTSDAMSIYLALGFEKASDIFTLSERQE